MANFKSFLVTCLKINIMLTALVTAEMQQCNLEVTDFLLVRETTEMNRWHQATDNLDGGGGYGDSDTGNNWSYSFNLLTKFDRFLFSTVDMTKWVLVKISEVTSLVAQNTQ